MAAGNDGWNDSKLTARAILHDRSARRKVIGRMLLFVMVLLAVGLWLIDGWLAKNLWLFILWWGGVALFTCMLMLFAVYDALAVIREERQKHH